MPMMNPPETRILLPTLTAVIAPSRTQHFFTVQIFSSAEESDLLTVEFVLSAFIRNLPDRSHKNLDDQFTLPMLKRMGSVLYMSFFNNFHPRIADHVGCATHAHRPFPPCIRIRIPKSLAILPWEVLFHPDCDFLATHAAIVRIHECDPRADHYLHQYAAHRVYAPLKDIEMKSLLNTGSHNLVDLSVLRTGLRFPPAHRSAKAWAFLPRKEHLQQLSSSLAAPVHCLVVADASDAGHHEIRANRTITCPPADASAAFRSLTHFLLRRITQDDTEARIELPPNPGRSPTESLAYHPEIALQEFRASALRSQDDPKATSSGLLSRLWAPRLTAAYNPPNTGWRNWLARARNALGERHTLFKQNWEDLRL